MQICTPYEPHRSLLERIRLARGLSRAKLAALAEVSPRAIAGIELEGVRPRRATAKALAAALGIASDWVLIDNDVAPAGNGRDGTTSTAGLDPDDAIHGL